MSFRVLLGGIILIMAANLSASQVQIKAEALPEYDALFRRTSGWTGADGDYSVALNEKLTLWLFSDTFVGDVEDNRRTNATLINNSVALQHIDNSKPVEFFYNTNAEDKPCALITPDDGRGYFWLFAGTHTSRGLYVFLTRVERNDEHPAFPFRTFGMALGHVPNPTESPSNWRVRQTQVPFCKFTNKGALLFGSATLKDGDYVYIYGFDSFGRDSSGAPTHSMVVARAPEDKLGDFNSWRFLSGGKWIANATRCDRLIDTIPTECSVSYIPGIKQFALVYTDGGIFGKIMVRLADKPQGPWGEPIMVYDCPDKDWHEQAYSYASKGHPELSKNPNELIVTYATNSTKFEDLFNDARLYWPRFVRLTFERSP